MANDYMASKNARNNLVVNRKSILLDDHENELIFNALNRKCFTLSTAVVQLLVTIPPDHINWTTMCTGVVCFVKDNPKRSYFISVYDLESKQFIFEQELYKEFLYKELRTFFHVFEANNAMAGLNFANETEARHFSQTIQEKLNNRMKKLQEKRTTNLKSPANHNQSIVHSNINTRTPLQPVTKSDNSHGKLKKRPLTKEDISTPTNFQHVQHIGWNAQTNHFETTNLDPKLLNFLQYAGVSHDQLKDKKTVKFIYKFLNENGGMDRAIAEFENPPAKPLAPPVVSHNQPTANIQSHRSQQLNPLANNNNTSYNPIPDVKNSGSSFIHQSPPGNFSSRKPAAPSVPAPPPPPPPTLPPAPAKNIPPANISSGNSVPPPPPPPPPPPAMNTNTAPQPVVPTPAKMPAPVHDTHSALMDQIRKGSTLNHVDPEEISFNHSSNGGENDIRDQLLDQIRKGVDLKRVSPNTNKSNTTAKSTSEIGGLAGALARALQERSRAINQTDDSSNSNSNSSDDEWED